VRKVLVFIFTRGASSLLTSTIIRILIAENSKTI